MYLVVACSGTAIPLAGAQENGAPASEWKALYQSGQKAMDEGQFELAVEILAKAERQAASVAGRAPAANGQGLALLKARRYAEAIPHFERALEQNPGLSAARKNLCFTLLKSYTLGLTGKESLDKADGILASGGEGSENTELGMEIKACQEREAKISAAPADIQEPQGTTWRELAAEGDAAEAECRFDQALKCYAKAEAISKSGPSRGGAANRQGLCLMKARKFEEAVESLQRAVAADPGSKIFLNNLGMCRLRVYEKTGNNEALDKALENLREVKTIDPSFKPEGLILAEEYAARRSPAQTSETKEGGSDSPAVSKK